MRESSGSTTAWWWSLQFSGKASPSTTEEEEVLERGRAAPGEGYGSPPNPSYVTWRGGGASPSAATPPGLGGKFPRGGGAQTHLGFPLWPPPLP